MRRAKVFHCFEYLMCFGLSATPTAFSQVFGDPFSSDLNNATNFTIGNLSSDQALGTVIDIAEVNGSDEFQIITLNTSTNLTFYNGSTPLPATADTSFTTTGSSLETTTGFSATVPPLHQYRDFGSCTCDLLVDVCDVLCCCDPDCDEEDREVFATCVDNSFDASLPNEMCVDNNFVISNHSKTKTFRKASNLLCLVYDNNPQRLFLAAPQTTTLVSAFDATWRSSHLDGPFVKVSEDGDDEMLSIFYRTATAFKSGDPMFLTSDNGVSLEKLKIPGMSDFSSECAADSGVDFLVDKSVSCSRTVKNLTTECSGRPYFNISTYVSGKYIPSEASLLALYYSAAGQAPDVPSSTAVFVPVQLTALKRKTPNGYDHAFAFDPSDLSPFFPAYATDSHICANLVTEVDYVIQYNKSTVTNVNVSVVLSSANLANSSVSQTFGVRFLPENAPSVVISRSGNPGYLDGYPIFQSLAGSDLNTMRLPRLGPTGNCLTENGGQQILFGENVQMSCFVVVNISDEGAPCDQIRDAVMGVLTNAPVRWPDYVAGFGNSTEYDSATWIIPEVTMPGTSNATTPSTANACSDVILGVSIEFAYAKVGFMDALQSRIVGVLYRFGQRQQVTIKDLWSDETNPSARKLELQFSVTFSDVSSPAIDLHAAQRTSYRLLPADFLSPF